MVRSVCVRLRAALITPPRHQRGRPWRPTARRSRHSWLRPGESGQRTEPGDTEGQQRWVTRLGGLLWPWQRRRGVDGARDSFVCGLGRGRRREGCDCVAADGRARWCLHPGVAAMVNRVGLDSNAFCRVSVSTLISGRFWFTRARGVQPVQRREYEVPAVVDARHVHAVPPAP